MAGALARRPPTWMLGALVALLGWRLEMAPPTVGLDASWRVGLVMALEDGLDFGREVVFSYGPLGFLKDHLLWDGELGVLAFLYLAALYVGFCVALVWALRRALPVWAAAAIGFAIVVALPLLEVSLLLAAILALGLLARERSEAAIVAMLVGGATFAAIECLAKLSLGPTIAVLFAIALIGARARPWQLGAYATLLVSEILLFWLASGQGLSALPDFLGNSSEIVSGYSEAMLRAVDRPAWQVTAATVAAVAVALGLVVASARGRYPDRRQRWAAIATMAVAAYVLFKQGVVRPDAAHLSLFFSGACVLWIAIPWEPRRWWALVAGAAAIAAMGVPARPPEIPVHANPVDNARLAAEQVGALFSAAERRRRIEAGRAAMQAVYALEPETLAALRGRTVAIEPWEIGVAWAYGLDWEPLPVFQSYSAYTSELDELLAAKLEGDDAPQRILRENEPLVYPEFPSSAIDGRFPGWEAPAHQRAILCRYQPLRTSERWQVLGRVADRCGRPQTAGSVEAEPGEPVPVPTPRCDEAVFARLEGLEVEGLEKVQTTLLHARTRHAHLDDGRRYRLVPDTGGDGLLLRGGAGLAEAEAFSPLPQARTIAVTGAGNVRFDFFRMRVLPLPGRCGAQKGSSSATAARRGASLSRSESSGSSSGHSTPTSGSSQAMPDSVAGS